MMFAKRHYEFLAAWLKERSSLFTPIYAESLADMLVADNPRFDRERFLTACGIPQEARRRRKDI